MTLTLQQPSPFSAKLPIPSSEFFFLLSVLRESVREDGLNWLCLMFPPLPSPY